MVTIISGSNRPENLSQHFGMHYKKCLDERLVSSQLLSLEHLPKDFIFRNSVFDRSNPELEDIVQKFVEPAEKFIVISPEYNGGFTGVLKAFIDSVKPRYFKTKPVALVGIASGRFGNVRGLDQLTNVFHYLNMPVHPTKVNVMKVEHVLDSNHEIADPHIVRMIDKQLDGFIG